MHLCYPSPFSWTVVIGIKPVSEESGCAAEQELFVDIHELVRPKLILIKNIRREKLRRDPAGKIFDSFAIPRSVDTRRSRGCLAHPTNPP